MFGLYFKTFVVLSVPLASRIVVPFAKYVLSQVLLVNGKVTENTFKTEKTKRGFPTQLPIVKLTAGRKKVEIYKGLDTTTFKVGQMVELKCSIMKVKSGNRISTKYILV